MISPFFTDTNAVEAEPAVDGVSDGWRLLAAEAHRAWTLGDTTRVGDLLRAMAEPVFAEDYRSDIAALHHGHRLGVTPRDASGDGTGLASRLLDSAQISTLPAWVMRLFLDAGEALIDARRDAGGKPGGCAHKR